MDIQLNKTYADVSNLLDGPLQSGYSYKDETYKNNINYIKINNHKIKKNYIKVDRELLEMRLNSISRTTNYINLKNFYKIIFYKKINYNIFRLKYI